MPEADINAPASCKSPDTDNEKKKKKKPGKEISSQNVSSNTLHCHIPARPRRFLITLMDSSNFVSLFSVFFNSLRFTIN